MQSNRGPGASRHIQPQLSEQRAHARSVSEAYKMLGPVQGLTQSDRLVLEAVDHKSPHLVFDDSHLPYLQDDGSADLGQRIKEGLRIDILVTCFDPTNLTYQVITIDGRLMGKIEWSDAFCVDLRLNDFIECAQKGLKHASYSVDIDGKGMLIINQTS